MHPFQEVEKRCIGNEWVKENIANKVKTQCNQKNCKIDKTGNVWHLQMLLTATDVMLKLSYQVAVGNS